MSPNEVEDMRRELKQRLENEQALAACNPTLRRLPGQGGFFVPAPSLFRRGTDQRVSIRIPERTVRRMVDKGLLRWGNKCRTFVVPAIHTPEMTALTDQGGGA